MEGHPKRYDKPLTIRVSGVERRSSTDSERSLPQSPMLDLVVGKTSAGIDYAVPMGYNLGHDLGDFLKWESENVYAAGFLGSKS